MLDLLVLHRLPETFSGVSGKRRDIEHNPCSDLTSLALSLWLLVFSLTCVWNSSKADLKEAGVCTLKDQKTDKCR